MADVRIPRSTVDATIAKLAKQGVQKAQGRTRDYAKANITTAGRVDTGQMRNGIVAANPTVSGTRASGDIKATARHSKAQHEGTGIYGPAGRPIRPRRAKVLRFKDRGGAFVFAPEVAGTPGVPFMTDALKRLRPSDFL